jgi:hypothetical protein
VMMRSLSTSALGQPSDTNETLGAGRCERMVCNSREAGLERVGFMARLLARQQ